MPYQDTIDNRSSLTASLAIDVGTTSTRAVLYRDDGQPLAKHSVPLSLTRIADVDGGVEQDAQEIVHATRIAVTKTLQHALDENQWPTVAGLTVQRSSVLLWCPDSGDPLSPVLSWQDRRIADWLASQEWDDVRLKHLSGLPRSPHYGAGKIRWLSRNVSECAPNFVAGPLASFLVQQLTRERTFGVDPTHAARMQLLDLKRPGRWCPQLLDQFEIQADWLPPILPSCSTAWGTLDEKPLRENPPRPPIKLKAMCGDQYASFYADAEADNSLMINLGTGGFVMCRVGAHGAQRESSLETTSLLRSPGPLGDAMLEGTINGVGSALTWAAEQYQLDAQQLRSELPTASVPPDLPYLFLNRVGGLASPWWKPHGVSVWVDQDGSVVRPSSHRDALLAVLESIAFLAFANIIELRNASCSFEAMRVSGGVSANDSLCQLLADLTQCRVVRREDAEATARGIARLARGISKVETMRTPTAETSKIDRFTPQKNETAQRRFSRFQAMIASK